jgi:two-component system OmpR family response regulator
MLPTVSPRVLLVDDDPVIIRLLEVNFRLDGFDVSSASHGTEALERVRAERPDAVVLDVMMPGLDGYQVAAAIREDAQLAATLVVFLTARSHHDESAEAGLDDVVRVTKPFDPIALVELVRSGLGARRDAG